MESPGIQNITRLYNKETYTNPEFEEKNREHLSTLKPKYSVLDTFGVPGEILENKETFLEWFEPRFFELRDKEGAGLQKFSESCQEALEILEKHKFLLSPKTGASFPVSNKIRTEVQKGFNNIESIFSFFKKVSVPGKQKSFLTPDRKSAAGAERLSTCRILSIAYVLEKMRESHDFHKFLEYSRFVLGRDDALSRESGLLSTLNTSEPIEILKKSDDVRQLFDWLGQGQKIKDCYLHNIGRADSPSHSHYISELHIGTKDGWRAFLKVLRDPESQFKPLDDFFRMRFILDDKTSMEQFIGFLYDIEQEAEKKTDPKIEIEFREKSYLTDEEKREYFPKTTVDKQGRTIGRGFLKKMVFDKNPSGGRGYRNLSAKIELKAPDGKQTLFAFEIQFMRKKELAQNERADSLSAHFPVEIRQADWVISRLSGKMKKEEIVRSLQDFLEEIKTEDMPKRITSEIRYPELYGGKKIQTVDFSGTLSEKAQKLFDMLVADGTLVKIAADFPTLRKPTREEKLKSDFYINENILQSTLAIMGVEKKGQAKTE